LFHTQKLLNRRDEFIILKRIGYSTADIVKLNTAGAAIPFATGILVFAALYIYYIYDIYSKIAELNLYQYDKFSISYIGILIIVVTMIITLAASVFLSVKGIEDESGAKQFRERNAG
jgi:ABC-type multidrug transport system permease subunit